MLIQYHPYEQIETINEDEDDDVLTSRSNEDGGVFIPLPESIRNYDWYALVTPEHKTSYTRAGGKSVSKDWLPDCGCVKKKHVLACMLFRNLDDNVQNYLDIKEELNMFRSIITNKINSMLAAFIVFCGAEVGMEIDGRPISNWLDYLHWIERCIKTREDAMKVIKSLYLSLLFFSGLYSLFYESIILAG